MSKDKEKTTVPIPPVGADGEQPPSKNYNQSITEVLAPDKDNGYQERSYEIDRRSDPAYLPTVTMRDLYECIFSGKPPIIDGLLYPGTYLFAGAPKVGKSFLMAQLAYHVSRGLPLWDYSTSKGTVLYLALEDTQKRLQKRLFRMFSTESTEALHFTTWAKQLNSGLEEQLHRFMQRYPDTKLIIVDTLQKIREAGGEQHSYASDYEVISKLKGLAEKYEVCLLLVHHTRKQQAEDKFDMISGTNGLLGAADGAFLLQKEKRTGNSATLDISGRDQQDQRLYLVRDTQRLTWGLERAETELWEEPSDPIIEAVASLVTAENPTWRGTPTELTKKLNLGIKPNVLSLRLNVNAERLLNEHQVRYERSRSRTERTITLVLEKK